MDPLLKALKKVVDGADAIDVIIFVIVLFAFLPLALIWLVVRIIQELE